MNLLRAKTALRYIFFETLPGFLMGVLVFISILLLFQALRLTEFVLVHGVKLTTVFKIMLYLSVNFLPVILPMSMLFSILLTYSRLSSDSEIVAFKSLGLSVQQLAIPAYILGIVTFLLSAQTSFYLGPWGNRKFEVLIHDLGQKKVAATIKPGVFSEGFFNLVVYANQVNPKSGDLKNLFIYDERDPKSPITIIARQGRILQQSTQAGQGAVLLLSEGSIHRTHSSTYTKVDFSTYSINLFDPYEFSERKKSARSMTLPELKKEMASPKISPKERTSLEIEYHTRWSISVACLIFAMLGVALGTTTNRRLAKASGFVLCLILIVSYWVVFVAAQNMARQHVTPPWVSLWGVDFIYLALGIWLMRRSEA